MTEQLRPVDRDDYERAYIVLHALKLKAMLGEDRPLWEILHEIHAEGAGNARVTADDLVGDDAASAEVTQALVLLELLKRGHTSIPDRPAMAAQTVCGVPGCPNLTTTARCLQHELEDGA
jgi:hypothetical protein